MYSSSKFPLTFSHMKINFYYFFINSFMFEFRLLYCYSGCLQAPQGQMNFRPQVPEYQRPQELDTVPTPQDLN